MRCSGMLLGLILGLTLAGCGDGLMADQDRPEGRSFTVPANTEVPAEAEVRLVGVVVGELTGVRTTGEGQAVQFDVEPAFESQTTGLAPTLRLGPEPYIELSEPPSPPVAEQTSVEEIFEALDPEARREFRRFCRQTPSADCPG